MTDEERIKALEARVKQLEDRQDGGCGCLVLFCCMAFAVWNIWTDGEVVRILLHPWTGQ